MELKNDVYSVGNSGLSLKSHFHNSNSTKPLPATHVTHRQERIRSSEPFKPSEASKAGNDYTASGHIVPLSVTTHHKTVGKDMCQRPVMKE